MSLTLVWEEGAVDSGCVPETPLVSDRACFVGRSMAVIGDWAGPVHGGRLLWRTLADIALFFYVVNVELSSGQTLVLPFTAAKERSNSLKEGGICLRLHTEPVSSESEGVGHSLEGDLILLIGPVDETPLVGCGLECRWAIPIVGSLTPSVLVS